MNPPSPRMREALRFLLNGGDISALHGMVRRSLLDRQLVTLRGGVATVTSEGRELAAEGMRPVAVVSPPLPSPILDGTEGKMFEICCDMMDMALQMGWIKSEGGACYLVAEGKRYIPIVRCPFLHEDE